MIRHSFWFVLLFLTIVIGACSSVSTNQPTGIQANTPQDAAQIVMQVITDLDKKSSSQREDLVQIFDENGVRFCPYYRTESTDRILTVDQFLEEFEDPNATPVLWGIQDGSGDPIEMNLREYWQRYVWDQPYHTLSTPHVVNTPDDFQGQGNMINNLLDMYAPPQYRIVEYYQPGQNPAYNGMDWTSLILVFRNDNNLWKLVAIAHGSWTI